MTTSVIIGTLHSVPNYCRKTLDYVLCWVSLEQENGSACRSQGALLCAGSHLLCGRAWEQWSAGGGGGAKRESWCPVIPALRGRSPLSLSAAAWSQLSSECFPLLFPFWKPSSAKSSLCVLPSVTAHIHVVHKALETVFCHPKSFCEAIQLLSKYLLKKIVIN